MPRLTVIAGLLAFSLFNYAQYQGWSLFADQAVSQPLRPGGTGGFVRSYHK